MIEIVELARPKVNLTLKVLGRRPDGFHELESLVAFADGAADQVTLSTGAEPSVRVTGPFAHGIAGPNLVETTLALLAAAAPGLRLGALTLEKNLPVAAGIGGGSADAAAVIRAVRRANADRQHEAFWTGAARRLGADVPVCLLDHAALMRGVGDRLIPVGNFPRLPAVLVNPMVPVPADKTAEVFRRLGAPSLKSEPAEPGGDPPLPRDGTTAGLLAFIKAGGNDLTGAATAVVPEVAGLLEVIAHAEGCRLSRLSGAGPTCFGLFETWRDAVEGALSIARERPGLWVRAVTLA